jgi:hypothetical protein
LNAHIVDNLE